MQQRKSSKLLSVFALFILSAPAWAVQDKWYPTAAVTQVRWDTYLDSIFTAYQSTPTVFQSTWTVVQSSTVWINPDQTITGYKWNYDSTIADTMTWTLNDFVALVQQEQKVNSMFSVADQDMEEYTVWPDTVTVPDDWQGWCLETINGHDVPVACP